MRKRISLRLLHFSVIPPLFRKKNMTSSNSSIIAELQSLIDQNDFLELTTSREQFPESRGSGLPLIRIKTSLCTAVIALQGAHLLNFTVNGTKPLLWVSPNCD